MSDLTAEREARIRTRAHQLWVEEGCPEGQAARHWELATQLIAIEDGNDATLKPRDTGAGPYGETIEPASALANQGDVPVLTDQGEKQPTIPGAA